MSQRILVVEDEPSIADNINYALKTEGFDPIWVSTGRAGLDLLNKESFMLAILDVGLPDIDGFEVAREIRRHCDIPVIFVTARSSEIDRVVGLEIGADDYVVKPFSVRELTARVKAVLRRTQNNAHTFVEQGKTVVSTFQVDSLRYLIYFLGNPLEISRYEFRLLRLLIEHPGRVYTREQLMSIVWEEPEMSLERTVDTHIKTIRQKLRSIQPDGDPIVTHRGIGYSLKEE